MEGDTWLAAGAELVGQQGSDIAATDDGDGNARGRKLFAVEEPGSGRDGATGLGRGFRILPEKPHRAPDLLFRDRDNVVDVGADMLKRQTTDVGGAQAVGDGRDGLLGGNLDDLARAQA